MEQQIVDCVDQRGIGIGSGVVSGSTRAIGPLTTPLGRPALFSKTTTVGYRCNRYLLAMKYYSYMYMYMYMYRNRNSYSIRY